MRRYWWIFGIVALLAGLYHGVMSGYLTQRTIAMTLKHARRQPSVQDQYADLRRLQDAIDKHDRRTAVLRTLTPDASASGIEEARAGLQEPLPRLERVLDRDDDDPDAQDAFDSTTRFFRTWEPPSISCLPPKAGLWSAVIFWVTFSLAALSGLVRLFAGPED